MFTEYLKNRYNGDIEQMFQDCDMYPFFNEDGVCERLVTKSSDYDFLFCRRYNPSNGETEIIAFYGLMDINNHPNQQVIASRTDVSDKDIEVIRSIMETFDKVWR